jgi:hypothetical protein
MIGIGRSVILRLIILGLGNLGLLKFQDFFHEEKSRGVDCRDQRPVIGRSRL